MIEFKESEDGQFFFVVKGANGEIVATSELYTRKSDAERGAEDLQGILDPSRASDAEAFEQIELEAQEVPDEP